MGSVAGLIVTVVVYGIIWAIKSKNKPKRIMPSNISTQNPKQSSFKDIQDELDRLLSNKQPKPIKEEIVTVEQDFDSVEEESVETEKERKVYKAKNEAFKEEEYSDENNHLLEDFDLRKAVVYSEIMKRRF